MGVRMAFQVGPDGSLVEAPTPTGHRGNVGPAPIRSLVRASSTPDRLGQVIRYDRTGASPDGGWDWEPIDFVAHVCDESMGPCCNGPKPASLPDNLRWGKKLSQPRMAFTGRIESRVNVAGIRPPRNHGPVVELDQHKMLHLLLLTIRLWGHPAKGHAVPMYVRRNWRRFYGPQRVRTSSIQPGNTGLFEIEL